MKKTSDLRGPIVSATCLPNTYVRQATQGCGNIRSALADYDPPSHMEGGGLVVEVYTKTIRLKNGKVLRAVDYGLEAFKFHVPKDRHAEYLKTRSNSDIDTKI